MGIHKEILQAVDRIRSGEVVAFPTETFFGLAVDPFNEQAVDKLLTLKQRILGQGISLIAADIESVNSLSIIERDKEKRLKLQDKFWPGALTIVVAVKHVPFSKKILADDASIALRVSSNEIATSLARQTGGFITATSANPHGKNPARNVAEVKNYFPEIFVIDGQAGDIKPSTMIDIQQETFRVIRDGAIKAKDLSKYL